jgi:predicted nucleic acid-binding protein
MDNDRGHDAAPDPPRALLDACVLYPDILRRLLLGAADAGLFVPVWSERVLDEWSRAAARAGSDAAAEILALRQRWPAAAAPRDRSLEARLTLPDPGDVHVLAAAIAGRADVLVTRNLRDFPARVLARDGVRAVHPDGFLVGLWQRARRNRGFPDRRKMAEAVHDAARRAGSPACSPPPADAVVWLTLPRSVPLGMRAGLPRLAKALCAV